MKFFVIQDSTNLLYVVDENKNRVSFIKTDGSKAAWNYRKLKSYHPNYWEASRGHEIRETTLSEICLLCSFEITNSVFDLIKEEEKP